MSVQRIIMAAACSIALGVCLGSAWAAPDAALMVQEHDSGLYSGAWRVERAWDEVAEQEFARFVQAIGEARERQASRLSELLANPRANPLWSPEDRGLSFDLDCAEVPYVFRAYFAYKMKLPFSFQYNKERRYKAGNRPREFRNFSQYPSFRKLLSKTITAVSSGHFRMRADLEATDTYPIEVTPESVRPGVTYYDPSGHVLIVYKVDRETGNVYMLDGHPDGTFTRKLFGPGNRIGSARFGGGFRAWRHYRIEVTDPFQGSFRLVRELNSESAHYSATDQYRWKYHVGSTQMTYHDWVRVALAEDGMLFDPVERFSDDLDSVCTMLQERSAMVDLAVVAGLHKRKHPRQLPRNIYTLSGDWGAWSTAALDVELRSLASRLRQTVEQATGMAEERDPRLLYSGAQSQLLTELAEIWKRYRGDPGCAVVFSGSSGEKIYLNLEDSLARILSFSFDPYHCPELRWGLASGTRLSACVAGDKLDWYEKEELSRMRTVGLAAPPPKRIPRIEPADVSVAALLHGAETFAGFPAQ